MSRNQHLLKYLSNAINAYKLITPSYTSIQKLYNNSLTTDHIAIRSLKSYGGIQRIKNIITRNSEYISGGTLQFPEKHLNAEWFYTTNPEFRDLVPRIFVSEIDESYLSNTAQSILNKYRIRNIDEIEYKTLITESEYAAWVFLNGNIINHLALNVPNNINIQDMIVHLQKENYNINSKGGNIKTSEDGLLHQASTMSDIIKYTLSNTTTQLPACFVEFVQRDKLSGGSIKEGFEANNALYIFDSTKNKRFY